MIDIIPAIDLKGGKCVRLLQGREEAVTQYSDDPLGVAAEWARQGATRIHIVNLDGALGRSSTNLEIVRSISRNVGGVIQYGGGLRSRADIEQALAAGASKVVLGTVSLEQPELLASCLALYGAEKIVVALDAHKGRIATRGWTHLTDASLLDVAGTMKQDGVREILYTDIERDGMMTGPDTGQLKALAAKGPKVIVSGGISSVADVRELAVLGPAGISGVIIGKALYEGRIDLRALVEEASSW